MTGANGFESGLGRDRVQTRSGLAKRLNHNGQHLRLFDIHITHFQSSPQFQRSEPWLIVRRQLSGHFVYCALTSEVSTRCHRRWRVCPLSSGLPGFGLLTSPAITSKRAIQAVP